MRAPEADTPTGRTESQTGRTDSQVRPRLLIRAEPERATTTEVPVPAAPAGTRETVFDIRDLSVFYGAKRAVGWTTLRIYRHLITAVIGPSGCGKSTFLRSLNRMNDAIPGFKLEGQILYHGHDVYGGGVNWYPSRGVGLLVSFGHQIFGAAGGARARPDENTLTTRLQLVL